MTCDTHIPLRTSTSDNVLVPDRHGDGLAGVPFARTCR